MTNSQEKTSPLQPEIRAREGASAHEAHGYSMKSPEPEVKKEEDIEIANAAARRILKDVSKDHHDPDVPFELDPRD
jgi:hypothetical protein